MTSKVFIYGSIKRGFYNHTRFGFDKKTKFLGERELKGAKMYDLGSFPCVVMTGDDNDVVYGELYEYQDQECEERIKQMEIGARYTEKEVDIDGEKVKTFVYDSAPDYAKEIESGVWRERK